MFKKTLIIGLGMVLGFAGLCLAKGTETAISTETIEPELVFEYKFDEPIVDVIFDETTMTVKEARELGMKGLEAKEATEIIRVQYPRAIVTKKAVKFLDEKGGVKRSVSLKRLEYKKEVWERPMVSLGTEKIVITGSEGEGEKEHSYLKWIDERGKEIKKINYGGEFWSALISGNGKYIVAGAGTFILYDINGKELWKKNIGVDVNEGAIHILYDGKVVFAGEQRPDWKPKISVINPDGSINWEYSLPAGHYGFYELFSTKNGKILLYMCKNGKVLDDDIYCLYGFNEKGDLLWQPKEYKGFKNSLHKLSVSQQANYLAGFTLWDHVWVMDIDTGKFIWKDPLKGWKPDTLQISPDGKYILLEDIIDLENGNAEYYSILLENGKVIKEFNFPIGKSSEIKQKTWIYLYLYVSPVGKFAGTKQIWRKKSNKIEIFNISDFLKEKD